MIPKLTMKQRLIIEIIVIKLIWIHIIELQRKTLIENWRNYMNQSNSKICIVKKVKISTIGIGNREKEIIIIVFVFEYFIYFSIN